MSFLDKVKTAAKDAAAQAQKGVGQLQTKVEVTQLRRKANDAAERLGYLIVRERNEGTTAGADADALVAEILALEEQIRQEDSAGPSAPAAGDAKPDD
jgi:aminoglycoside phosphotransferase family enzyme